LILDSAGAACFWIVAIIEIISAFAYFIFFIPFKDYLAVNSLV
jgi:hypothetical protein